MLPIFCIISYYIGPFMQLDTMVFHNVGFGSFRGAPSPPSGHTHDAFEISAFAGGCVTMLFGGQAVTVPPDRLVVHWGMLPHQMLRRDPGAEVVGVHVPLSWVLEWSLPSGLISRLLDLQPVIEAPRRVPFSDLALLQDWYRLLNSAAPEAENIVRAEIHGRLLRLAPPPAEHAAPGTVSAAAFSRALQFIARHFRDSIFLADIARAAGISRRHLTRLFAEYTGQTVNGYITHLRLSHARRLLTTTDRKVLDVMHDSGFSCPTQFYRKFQEQTGLSPRRYRVRAG